jgi:rSAM/selenodomain-associated transferase 2
VNAPSISIIIPTLDEAAHIGHLIDSLQTLPGPIRDIVISDGGSRDATVSLARKKGATVIESVRGRGAQLNAGAKIARGAILWFVHADAKLHRRSLDYLHKCAQNPQICGGNFRLRFDTENWNAHLFARIARQQRRQGIYYGDSGFWVRREIFVKLNGFAEWPLFEDYDFARRLEQFARLHGKQTALAPWTITVSSRRFHDRPLRVLLQWLWLQTLFLCGVPPEKLAALYHRNR